MAGYSAALDTIQPNFPPGVLQGDPRFTHAYYNMSSGTAQGPWNEGRGPWAQGERWEFIDDPVRQVVETQGQLRKDIHGTARTQEEVSQANRELSRKRSQEIKAAVPAGENQWSPYPQKDPASPKQVQKGR